MNRTFSPSLAVGLTVALIAGPLLQVARSERLWLPWTGQFLFSRPQFDPVSKQATCKSTTQPAPKTAPLDKRPVKQPGLLAVCVQQRNTTGGTQSRGPAVDESWLTGEEWQEGGAPAAGVPVTFALSSDKLGELSGPTTVTTDAQGLAQVKFMAAQRRYKGSYTATACNPADLNDCDAETFDLEVVNKSSTALKLLIGAAAVGLIIGIIVAKKDDGGGNAPIAAIPPPRVN